MTPDHQPIPAGQNPAQPVTLDATRDDAPWRAAPLAGAQLAQHARQLAREHALLGHPRPDTVTLPALLEADAGAIAAACDAFGRAMAGSVELPPAALRLLAGQHLLDGQVRLARAGLRAGVAALPRLAPDGAARAWRLVRDAVARGDGGIDPETLAAFLAAYQEHTPLAIAELDALPALLRLALVDNLRRLAARAERTCAGRAAATGWLARLLDTADTRPGDLILLVADMARGDHLLDAGFVAELGRRLHGRGGTLTQVLDWIDARLADDGNSIARYMQLERSEQADDAVSVGNSLAGLRLLGGVDWRAFAERLGAVDTLLRGDPDGSYPRMDGATRDAYRHAVARLARATGRVETDVAQEAIALAAVNRAPSEGGLDPRTRHVGHYLAGPGVEALEARLAGQRRRARTDGPGLQIGVAALVTLLLVAAIVVHARQGGAGWPLMVLTGLLALPGASEVALALVRMCARRFARSPAPPRMDVDAGIPAAARTIVAVEAQAQDAAGVAALCDGLAVRYLGNRDARLRFCLLLDLPDAAHQDMPDDAAIVDAARAAIEALNRQYGHERRVDTVDEEGAPQTLREHIEPFMLLVRARSRSDSEQAWIGRERRRGQLADLNAWLCGAHDRFAHQAGNTGAGADVRYVIALDADTYLPRDGARSLVAAMAHPLCLPFQDDAGRVLEGHGMLRLDNRTALPGRSAPRLARLWPGQRGGWAAIHDVDAWRRALGDTVQDEGRAEPGLVEEDRLRAGRAPDLVLESHHAASPGEYLLRRHRALRGAWQEAARLGRGKDALRGLTARWRLADTLRAGLVAPASLALLLLCWCLLAAPVFWGATVLAVFFLPALLGMLLALGERPADAPWRQHLDGWARTARVALVRAAMHSAFLPHAAWYDLDALVRGLWRRQVAHRKLLEWRPALLARPDARMDNNWRTMWFAPLLAVGTAVLLTFANPYAVFAAAPLLLVWFLAPVLAWWSAQPTQRPRLGAAQTRFLGTLARRTWAFFEDHGVGRHALAPETVAEQAEEDPDTRMAPASAGLALLAALGARDFGYLPLTGLLRRGEAAITALAQLERWHGHPFQYYQGMRLTPVEPAYVDTAASGSLVLSLRTFAAGLDELPDRPVLSPAALDGIRTTLRIVQEHAPQGWAAPQELFESLAPARWGATDTLPGLAACLRAACAGTTRLKAGLPDDAEAALRGWVSRLASQCDAQLDDLQALAPWMRAEQEYVLDASMTRIPTLRELAAIAAPAGNPGLAAMVDAGRACASARLARVAALAAKARAIARMDFGVLVDPASGQLATGCHVRDKTLDDDSVDLLASSARMASFVAVAQDQLPQRHWWTLGRPLRMAGGSALLLSRSGGLAELLEARVLTPGWRATLLDSAARALVAAQAAHARRHGMLWGFTRSGANAVDAAGRHRVESFGLPAGALQRRADDDLAAAPHAAALALGVAPGLAATNLQRMAEGGLLGDIGYYEALDYGPHRLPQGERQLVVRSRSARHQALTLLALAQHLLGEPMQRRFCRDPELRAALGLLHEPVPASGAAAAPRPGTGAALDGAATARPYARVIGHDSSALPEVQLLSNGSYHLAIDSDGRGASRWLEATLTATGMACFVRDVASGAVWSNTLQPALTRGDAYEAVFAEGRASFRRADHGIEMHTDVVVAPDDDVELRRIRIVNRNAAPRTLELTGCVELAAPPLQDSGRSGVQCEFDAASDSLLCVTAPDAPVIVHRMLLRGVAGQPSMNTDRLRFVGRGHDASTPQAVQAGGALAGLDAEPDQPLLALRRTVTLAPQQELVLDLVLGVAASRAVARELAKRYGAGHRVDHAIEAAWIHAQADLRRMEVSAADAQLYTRLAGCLLQPVPALRADPAVIARNVLGRAALAPYGVSGEIPLLLLQVPDDGDGSLARQVLQAHAWWRGRGLAVDLLLLCDGRAAREAVMHLAMPLVDPASFDQPGGVHLQLLQDVPQEDRILLRAIAWVLLSPERGDLADQLRRAARPGAPLPPPFAPAGAITGAIAGWRADAAEDSAPPLVHDNGIGGFSADGREYIVRAGPDVPTPGAPWSNPLSNPDFGSVLDERGQACTWRGTRAEQVSGAEAFYLRDEDSGAWWSPTPWPAPSGARYVSRHGFGYSEFTHRAHGIRSGLRCFVAPDAPLKYCLLTLRNDSDAPRRLSATGYVDWVLDAVGAMPGMQVVTGADLASGALFARNAFGAGFHDQVAFFHVEAEQAAFTCDRAEFVGRQGSLARPAALGRAGLSGAFGAGLDPCAALQVAVTLAPGQERTLVFVLGVAGPGTLDASRVVQRHGGIDAANAAWTALQAWWDATLGAVQVGTPDAALDARLNGWLPYQAIGALHGGIDPAIRLQSALALVHARPELLRTELLRTARDFAAAGAPVVEDFLWLPFALARYLAASGDLALLGVQPFDADGGVASGDDLYGFCVHGLRGCLRFGARGLPPAAGRLHDEAPRRGESVRLAFFMAATLQRFAEVADRRGDFGFATTCRGAALALKAQCEEHGWDGQWYRWAYLDNGNVLGASANPACRVDLETQAWAVLAGAAQGAAALRAARARLQDDGHGALRLCEPPVDGHWSERVVAGPGQDHRATALAALGLAQAGDVAHAWQLWGQLDPLAREGSPPYFLAGGVRTVAPHAGRSFGGSFGAAAGWTWLLALESLLGLERGSGHLRIAPRLPAHWDGFALRYRHRGAIYEITVRIGAGEAGVWLDDKRCPDDSIPLLDDRRDHKVEVRI